jgi:multidrug efflux pump subunit AcrA (membrane-fusion protein)
LRSQIPRSGRRSIDGVVANRKTRVGEYVAAGTRMLSIVPTENLWVEANYRETQTGRMKVGDPVRIDVDTYPGSLICGYVEAILPAAGAEFARIPPDNATGNFTKIVRRFTVRIRSNVRDANAALARPGMSVETAVAVSRPTAPLRPNEAIGSAAHSIRRRTWSSGRSPGCRSIPDWAALVRRASPARAVRYRRHTSSLNYRR